MLYLLAIVVPPVAVLQAGRPRQVLLNVVLTALGWFPGVVHAFIVVRKYKATREAATGGTWPDHAPPPPQAGLAPRRWYRQKRYLVALPAAGFIAAVIASAALTTEEDTSPPASATPKSNPVLISSSATPPMTAAPTDKTAVSTWTTFTPTPSGAMSVGTVLPSPMVSPTTASAPATWRVTKVVDGDTVDVVSSAGQQERIRVIGIDTPEQGECGFAEASAALGKMVQSKVVTLVPGARDDRDRYDRLLRYLDVDGRDAGLELIRGGYAIARYDSRDGYGRHSREDAYVAADLASPDICATPSPSIVVTAAAPNSTTTSAPVQVFRNCAELSAVYPGGVARVGVTGNTVSGVLRPFRVTPVFDDTLYAANQGRDGDGDGVACEQ